MAKIVTRDELKKVLLEELGSEFHNIEITDNQWDNLFDKAMKKMYENDMVSNTQRVVGIELLSDFDKASKVFTSNTQFNALLKRAQELTNVVTNISTLMNTSTSELKELKKINTTNNKKILDSVSRIEHL